MQPKPHEWTDDEFSQARSLSLERWRRERISDPLEVYLAFFARARGAVNHLLEASDNLNELTTCMTDVLLDEDLRYALRYLTAPVISEDDFKQLVDSTLSRRQILDEDSDVPNRAAEVVLLALDAARFPWLSQGRAPSAIEREAAVVATAALVADSRAKTHRRNDDKTTQEELVCSRLEDEGLVRVPPRRIDTVSQAPLAGEFCGECEVAGRKADIVVRLWDGRLMPIECKVSNSFTNSIKRLNNDAAVKAQTWLAELGRANVVPAAVLAGAYKLKNLADAQNRGLSIFWSHDLRPLVLFIEETKMGYA